MVVLATTLPFAVIVGRLKVSGRREATNGNKREQRQAGRGLILLLGGESQLAPGLRYR